MHEGEVGVTTSRLYISTVTRIAELLIGLLFGVLF